MALRYKPGGVGISFNPDGSIVEVDTVTCSHWPCQKIIDIPNKRTMMERVELCRACMKLICLECAGKKVCTTKMREIDRIEQEHYRKQQFRKSLGV